MVDADGERLGRLASRVAGLLQGKHRPDYSRHQLNEDFVIVVNASKVGASGNKLAQKVYYRHSGYLGSMRTRTLAEMLSRFPERVIELAVRGMLPRNRLGRRMLRRLKVYAGAEHPHEAQVRIGMGKRSAAASVAASSRPAPPPAEEPITKAQAEDPAPVTEPSVDSQAEEPTASEPEAQAGESATASDAVAEAEAEESAAATEPVAEAEAEESAAATEPVGAEAEEPAAATEPVGAEAEEPAPASEPLAEAEAEESAAASEPSAEAGAEESAAAPAAAEQSETRGGER